MVRRIIRIIAGVLAALAIAICGLLVYLGNADLSAHKARISAFVEARIGHELEIGGPFELEFGRTTKLTAREMRLRNPDWAAEPSLIRLRHVVFAFNTWSLFSRPFLVEELSASNIEVLIARDQAGRVNWVSSRLPPRESSDAPPDLTRFAFRRVAVENLTIRVSGPNRPVPIIATLEYFRISPDQNDLLDLDLRGDVNDLPVWADGRIGPWRNLVDARDISADLDLTVGQARLALAGSVVDLVKLEGAELEAVLSGPDIGGALERLGLPRFADGPFEIHAGVTRGDASQQVRLEGSVGQIRLLASGHTDSILAPSAVDYDFNVNGPDAGSLAEFFGVHGVPSAPFQVTGEYSRDGSLINLDSALLRIGPNSVALDGTVDLGQTNVDMDVSGEGPDFSVFGPFLGRSGLPKEAFTASGRIRKNGAVWQAENVDARVGQNRLLVDGQVVAGGSGAAEISVQASGPDLSIVENVIARPGLPAGRYDVAVVARSDPRGVRIDSAVGTVGEIRLEADGVVALQPGFDGSTGSIWISGPEFREFAAAAGMAGLPSGPFTVSTGLAIKGESLHLDNAAASIGTLQGTAGGDVRIGGSDSGQFSLSVMLAGSDVAALGVVEQLGRLAGEPFRVEGHIGHAAGMFTADGLQVALGNIEATISGAIGVAAAQTRLSVSARAANSTVLLKAAALPYLPAGILVIDGKLDMSSDAIRLDDATLAIGDYRVSASGTLDLATQANESDLAFSLSGPDIGEAGRIAGLDSLPEKDFAANARFQGTPTGFGIRDITARIGDSRILGGLDASLDGKPRIVGNLSSSRLDLSGKDDAGSEPAAPEGAGKADPDRRLFSDQPLALEWLQSADADLTFRIDRLIADSFDVTDVDMRLALEDGALRIDPVSLRQHDGSATASFSIEPRGDQHVLRTSAKITDIRIGALGSPDDSPMTLPPLSGSVQFEGAGQSMRSIMASANGAMSLRHGSGQIRQVFGTFLFRDILSEVLRTINPLKRDRDYRLLQCGIYDLVIDSGIARIQNFVIQTDRMTTVATGEINLRNEQLNVAFRAKPREGIGISLGTIANQLLEVRGTLLEPKIRVDAARTATTTGAAVATGGLSLLARGVWDRLSAEGDVCKQDGQE